MTPFTIPIADVGELATKVAVAGAIGASGGGDDMFEYIIGIVVLVYEMSPG